jgi:O-antigen ligase
MGFLLPAYQRPRRIIPNPGTVIILIYLFICIFLWGIGISHFDGNAVESTKVRALFYYLSMIGIALYILARIYTARSRAILLGCLASGLFFSSVIGLVQNTAGINLVTPLIPAGFTIAEGGLNPAGQVTERAGAARAIGTFAHAIEFSVAMSAGFFLLVHFARYATQRRTRYVARIAALASLLAVPAAISRSGIIALLAGSLVYVWALKLRHIAGSILAVGVAVPAFAALFPNTATALWSTIIGSDTDTSVLARLGRYDRVAASFHADPMFGKGLGASTEGTLDNQWLDTLVQGGVVGVFGMFLLIAGALLGFAAAVRYANDTRERDQAFAIGAAITAIAVTSSTFDLLGFEQIAFILFLLFGLAWSSFPSAERRANLDRRSALRAG